MGPGTAKSKINYAWPRLKMHNSRKGFTLVELMLATFLLSLVLAGLISLFINVRYLNDSNQNLIIAAAHAQFVMEEIKGSSSSVAAIESAINAGDWSLDSGALQGAPYYFAGLSNESVAAAVFQSGNPLAFNVTVRWSQGSMVDHEYILETLISQ